MTKKNERNIEGLTPASGLLKVKDAVSVAIAEGRIDDSVIRELVTPNGFAPVESELLDYKREVPHDEVAFAKLLVHISSFHNTYGGYLIFGVDEQVKDQHFVPIGVATDALSIQQLRARLRNATARSVDVAYSDVHVRFNGKEVNLGLLFVPKRKVEEMPLRFGRQGAVRDGKPVFNVDDVFFRVQDTNRRAIVSEDWWFLSGERNNPHVLLGAVSSLIRSSTRVLDENLPDRNLICPRFIGRSEEVSALWSWLSDPLQHVKVLAGDGGKGKSSIAFQFAEAVCKSRAYDFEKVIWVSGKQQQFRAIVDEYDPMNANFSSYAQLLGALAEKMPLLLEEVEGASPHLLKAMLRDAFNETHTLVVIDDVDSLEVPEQRLVFDAASDLGSTRTRFLLTTRNNVMYSADRCIVVQGFSEDEYEEYVNSLANRLAMQPFKAQEVAKLRVATDGSPLYTESLVRLIRNKMPFGEAIGAWKNTLGVKVRRAALERELKQLSIESRRLLLAAAHLVDCSYTELKQVCDYEDPQMQQSLQELDSMFLLSAPRVIRSEPRFSVQSNTRTLVLLMEAKLVVDDPSVIRDACKRIRERKASVSLRKLTKDISAAITQSNAFLRAGDWERARETLEARARTQRNNPDLEYALGRLWMSKSPPDFGRAKKHFKDSHDAGMHKYQFFADWFESEMTSEHSQGAVHVATLALKEDGADRCEWLVKRAAAHRATALLRNRHSNFTVAIGDYKNCMRDLKAALPLSKENQRLEIATVLEIVSEERLETSQRVPLSIPGKINVIDTVVEGYFSRQRSGDVLAALCAALESMVKVLESREVLSLRETNLLAQQYTVALGYLRTTRDRLRLDTTTPELRLTQVSRRIEAISLSGNLLEPSEGRGVTGHGFEFDVFLAHNSRDKPVIRRIYSGLLERGLRPWLDEKEIPPGQLFQDQIQKMLPKSWAVAIAIGEQGIGKWQAMELRVAISGAVGDGRPVIPLLLPGVKSIPDELSFLSEFNYVLFASADDPQALGKLEWGVRYRPNSVGSE